MREDKAYEILHFILEFDIQLPSDVSGLILKDASLDEHLCDHQLGGWGDTLHLLL